GVNRFPEYAMTWLDLPLTSGSVQAEALCDVHAQSARTVQPGDTSGMPLAVPPMNARPSAHQLVETRPRVRSTAPTVRLDHGCRVGRSRRDPSSPGGIPRWNPDELGELPIVSNRGCCRR